MNKKIVKIGVYGGIPVAIGSIASGLYFGLRKSIDDDSLHLSPEVEYFQNQILGSNMHYSFLFPQNGKNLLDKFILLNKNIMSDEFFKERMMRNTEKSSDGNLKATKKIKIDFKLLQGESEINKRFNEVNKELFDFVKGNKLKPIEGRWGLHWSSNIRKDAINISIYKIDPENKDDSNFINNYIDSLKSSKVNFTNWFNNVKKSNLFFGDDINIENSDKKIDFTTPIQSYLSLKSNQMMMNFPFMWKENSKDTEKIDVDDVSNPQNLYETNLWNKNSKIKIKNDPSLKEDANVDVNIVWSDDFKIPYKAKYSNQAMKLRQYYFNEKLMQNKIIPVVKPFFDFSETKTNNSKMKFLFTFYKLDKNSQMDFTQSDDVVKNPKNIYSRVIELNWTNMLDQISSTSEKSPIPITSNSIKNKDVIFNSLKNEWMKYISNPFAGIALPMLHDFFPSIGRSTKNLYETFSILDKIKKSNLQINSKDSFKVIFNEEYGKSNKTLVDRIFEKINSANYVEPQTIFKVWFKDFDGGKDSIWSKLETFRNNSNIIDTSNGMSTSKQLYYFYAGAQLFEPIIRGRLKELISDNLIENFYDHISSKIIPNFIKDLKERNILKDKNFSSNDFLNESKRNGALLEVINAVMSGKKVKLPRALFNFLQLGDYTAILDPIVNGNYIGDVLKLIIGNKDPKKVFADILKDPSKALLDNLSKNISTNKKLASKVLGNIVKTIKNIDPKDFAKLKTVLDLQNRLSSLLGPDYLPLVKGLINGFLTSNQLTQAATKVPSLLQDLLNDIYNNKWKSLFNTILKTDKDGIKIFSDILHKGIKNSDQKNITKLIDILKDVDILKTQSSYINLILSKNIKSEDLSWILNNVFK